MRQCCRELGYEVDSVADAHRWVIEREEAIFALQRVCKEHGDTLWGNDLHLADIIEKHLGRHLDATRLAMAAEHTASRQS